MAAKTKWSVVLDDLQERLAAGEFAERFPTDRELVERYGVSRQTVREAVRRLRARGIVERHRGRGSFVRDEQMHQDVGSLYSLFREVERRGHEQRSEVLTLGPCTHPVTAAQLDLEVDAPLVVLARLRLANGVPLAMDTVWLPEDLGSQLLDADMTHTSLYDELERRCGITIDATEEVILPVVADEDTSALLEVEPGTAIFRVERRGFAQGRPVEWRITLISGEHFAFVSTWQRDAAQDQPRFEPRSEPGSERG